MGCAQPKPKQQSLSELKHSSTLQPKSQQAAQSAITENAVSKITIEEYI